MANEENKKTQMKALYLAIIIVLAGLVLYLFLTRKPPDVVIGPSQKELNEFKQKKAKTIDSLKTALQAIIDTQAKEAKRYQAERVNSTRVISYWKKRASEAKEGLSDSLPDSTIISEQAKIIVFQDSVIEKQASRILTDSAYIQNIEASFTRRLGNEQQQRQLLEEENRLQAKVIEDQKVDAKNRKRKERIEDIAQYGVILGLLYLIGK